MSKIVLSSKKFICLFFKYKARQVYLFILKLIYLKINEKMKMPLAPQEKQSISCVFAHL